MITTTECIPSPVRRAGFLLFSALLHVGLIALALWAARAPTLSDEAAAGKAGDSLNITLLQIQHAELSAGQTATSAASAAPARSAPEASDKMPAAGKVEIALPAADKPRIAVAQAPAAKTPARKPAGQPAKKSPEREKAPRPAARVSTARQATEGHADPSANPSPAAARASSSAGSAGRLTAAAQGDSNSGQAARGAGAADAQKLTALNRRVNYPTRARSLGVEGRVRVRFDVTDSGTVTNIRILTEDPVGVFAASVMKDMARWRYRAQTTMANQTVSIIFKLDGNIRLEN